MEMKMKVETISKEIIKPSSPTPDHLRTENLCFVDHFAPAYYGSAVLFYNNISIDQNQLPKETIFHKLKKSLSEVLTKFYPMAARIDGSVVRCNDEGAVFMEADAECFLSDVLKNPSPESLKNFLPVNVLSVEASTWPLLLVKASFFKCRGLALGVCLSHKIFDVATAAMFLRSWTDAARNAHGHSNAIQNSEFTASSVLPALDNSVVFQQMVDPKIPSYTTKRFLFEASKIAELRTRAASERVKDPTRVESVTALFWKCARRAAKSNSGISRPTALQQSTNLRGRVSSLTSSNVIGNLVFLVPSMIEEPEMSIQGLVNEMRRKKEKLEETLKKDHIEGVGLSYVAMGIVDEITSFLSAGYDADFYTASSWCKMSFYENADFGWGVPVWISGMVSSAVKNFLMLIDAKDGKGIEAWVTLSEQDMSVFEHDPELLQFASPNPSVLI